MSEETRAAAFRQSLVNRLKAEAANERRLAGSPAQLAVTRANWEPLRRHVGADATFADERDDDEEH